MSSDDRQLDRLAETIERLRARIAEHEDHIGGHETRTRVILIDPLLRSLGWETEDPDLVVHEYPVGRRKVDYALLLGGEVVGILEAKALGSQLNDSDWGKYVAELPGLPMVAFTNGNEWRFFRKLSGWHKETVKVSSGERFKTGWDLHQVLGRHAVRRESDGPKGDRVDWMSLSDIFPIKSKPTQIRIGDELIKDVQTWGSLYVEVARYLHETDALRRANFEVSGPSGKTKVISRSPERSPGKRFAIPKEFVEGLWLDAHGGAKGIPRKVIYLLEKCGENPDSVTVSIQTRGN